MKKLVVLGQELNVRLSPSFIQNAACPLYLKLHYIDKVDERYVRVEAERGAACHAAIAELTGICQDRGIQPQELTDLEVREAVQHHTPPAILGEVGLIFQWTQLWRDRFKLSKHLYGFEEKLALDEDFDECAWEEGAYRGILDLLDVIHRRQEAVVTDYKSQPHIMSQTELDTHEPTTHYAWLASKLLDDIEVFKVRIWYLRYGFYMETTRTQAELEAYEHVLMIKERKICDIRDWNPVPGPHCQMCDVIHRCPMALEADGLNQVISQAQAVEAAKRLTALKVYSEVLSKKLKEYIDHNDDVRVSDQWVYGFHHLESTYWEPAELAEILAGREESGVSLADFTNVDKRKLEKLLKQLAKDDPALEDAIMNAKKVRHQTRFQGYKPGANGEVEGVD